MGETASRILTRQQTYFQDSSTIPAFTYKRQQPRRLSGTGPQFRAEIGQQHKQDQRSHVEKHVVDQISPEHGVFQEGSVEQIRGDEAAAITG